MITSHHQSEHVIKTENITAKDHIVGTAGVEVEVVVADAAVPGVLAVLVVWV